MSGWDWLGVTLIVINSCLGLVVLASLPLSIKRRAGVPASLIFLFSNTATIIWIYRALQWQA
jgi:hypothetical protein